ncbi:MAG: hypothetical protein FJ044_00795 [Candidatus Cloacimonetes bacterium]|nr:hypothetical protein [Candidatus Cloacimonadota bacterium]
MIEILVTVAILGLISTAAISIFTSMTAAYNKSRIINELREEGTRVMSEMETLVRASENAEGSGSSTLILTLNSGSLEYQQNGQCKTVTLSLGSATADKNNYINKALSVCEAAAIGAGELTNTNRTSGVNVSALTFSVTGSGPKVVKINLILEQGLDAATRQDYRASVNLETTVSTRSY